MVADFGMGKRFSIPFRIYSNEILTLWYRAPEILLGDSEYGIGVDIWSLGIIFVELFLGEPLIKEES
jgi:serine/threonine protein kinase